MYQACKLSKLRAHRLVVLNRLVGMLFLWCWKHTCQPSFVGNCRWNEQIKLLHFWHCLVNCHCQDGSFFRYIT